ncbi:MAG: hypothetical protein NZ951_05335 [Dehalococcoidia bacterium]|nr:hypothetical protein [Dehalococcoidia bacterium]MDW8120195.1 hypothetical protein [Chloroflexota bacterium]
MGAFFFERECRTPSSECYTVFEDDEEVGRLDIHFAPSVVHASLFVHERLTQDAIQELVQVIEEELLDAVGIEREEVVLHLHQGRDLGVLTLPDMGEDTNHGERA